MALHSKRFHGGQRPMVAALPALALAACLCSTFTPSALAQTATTPDTAPIQVRSAQGKAVNAATLPWKAPQPARLQFTVQGQVKGFPFQTSAQLDWRPDGARYAAAQEVQIPLLGARRQSSTGAIGPQGLQPEIFMDRGRREGSATFDVAAKQIVFSRGTPNAPWVRGTQDRMSVFFQVAGMLAAAPQRYPRGTQITLQAASDRRVSPWTFRVLGNETVQLPAGKMAAVKLQHIDGDADAVAAASNDPLQSAIWLAPSLQYLPVRIRLVEGPRDTLDLQLQSHTKP